ncbi:hypothetical protein NADFUDRAFT_51223 [Nadsonia fulvescens var. elongata DSM 6958]|uniref:Nucleoporin NUP49/NSP49 n=1 Tax=Nadsonia fulvescens var. elongata DSM 6958 TaxID=857566 RepID=A0A1E3PKJ7_9ASCO|nr:hypothetical protein NADFUDRAFT_51223 [Nadsonia fulvescens var. elongata DSM 6958]
MFGFQNNTQPAPSGGGMFGQNAQPQASGTSGMFGQNTNNNATGGGLFGNTSNTAPKPAFGGFGSSTQPTQSTQPSTGGFGGFGATSNTNTTGGFGGFGATNNTNNNNNQSNLGFGINSGTGTFGAPAAPSTGGLFGLNSAAPASSGGLFGSNTAIAPASGGLFGTNNNPQNTGGIFGQNTQLQAPTTGGLFGGTNTNTTAPSTGLFGSKPAASGGLFGSSAPATGGLFGNSNTGTSGGGGLFGSKPTAPTGGLFSSTSQQPVSSGLGGGLFGGTNQQQQQSLLQQQPQQPQVQVTALTRPVDLPESMQKELESIDEYINSQVRIADEFNAVSSTHDELMQSIPMDVELLSRKYTTANEALVNDSTVLAGLKKKTDASANEADICFQLLGRINSLPSTSMSMSSFGSSTFGSSTSTGRIAASTDALSPYYERKYLEFAKRIKELTEVITEVEKGVDSVEREGMEGPRSVESIITALQEEYKLFMGLGSKVAELHHLVGRLDSKSR